MSGERFELPEEARRIRDREALDIERRVRDHEVHTPEDALSLACDLLSRRSGYMGAIGEGLSVQDYAGILVVDYLDERIVRAIQRTLSGYLEQSGRKPTREAEKFIRRNIPVTLKGLPQFPVAYAVLFVLRDAFEWFNKARDGEAHLPMEEKELGLIVHLLEAVDRYLATRDQPVQRHFSEMEREYSSVSRLKCDCGKATFRVVMQALQAPEGGMAFDRLDLQCSDCGHCRTVMFDLPWFRDMYQL